MKTHRPRTWIWPLALPLFLSLAGCEEDGDSEGDGDGVTGAPTPGSTSGDEGQADLGEAGSGESGDGDGDSTGEPGTDDGDTGDLEVSLTDDVLPLYLDRCGFCHTRTDSPAPPAVANNVFLEEKGDLLGLVGSFIIAGDSANSGLIAVSTGDFPVGMGPTVMPPPGSGKNPFSEAEAAVVAAWIDAGAQDN